MAHTQAFYDERRAKKVAQSNEYRKNRREEKVAYRKIFYEVEARR